MYGKVVAGALILAGVCGIMSYSPTARSTTFLERPFPESVKEAPVIVRGTIGNSYVDWARETPVGGRRIFTYWELQVSEVLKGVAEPKGAVLRLREMGGEKDGIGMQVAGSATFNAGEDTVAFLSSKNSEGTYDVWGMSMGKFLVSKDPDGQEFITGPGIGLMKAQVVAAESGEESVGESGQGKARWAISALRRLVASQGDAPDTQSVPASAHAIASPKLQPSEVASPRPSISVSTVTSNEGAAPQLQPSASEVSSFSWVAIVALGAVALGVVGILLSRKS